MLIQGFKNQALRRNWYSKGIQSFVAWGSRTIGEYTYFFPARPNDQPKEDMGHFLKRWEKEDNWQTTTPEDQVVRPGQQGAISFS